MQILRVALFFAILSLVVTVEAGTTPNVILAMTDDQGLPDLSYYGNPEFKTPNMDRLARQSVRLTDFHVNPFCSPTRAALMTGRMSDRTRVTSTNDQRNYLGRAEVLMPEFFKASGYRTGIFGKWHIGANVPYRPIDRGFDEWIGLGNGGLGAVSDFWNNDRMNDLYWHNGEPKRFEGFSTDVYFDEAIRFIKKQKDTPFFAYIATNVPHWDWNIEDKWLEEQREDFHIAKRAYYASIAQVDRNLGRLDTFLQKSGLAENTIPIFLTDNGSDIPIRRGAYTAGMRGFKGALYDGGHRVPCFIRAPHKLVGKPRDVAGLTCHFDLLPTLIDLCDLQKPTRDVPEHDGRSLRPLLSSGTWPDRFVVMHHHNGREPVKADKAVILTESWRLILPKAGSQPELFDIHNDKGQVENIATRHPDVVADLLARYDDHWETLPFNEPGECPVLTTTGELRLTCDLTRTPNLPSQSGVRRGLPVNSVWDMDYMDFSGTGMLPKAKKHHDL